MELVTYLRPFIALFAVVLLISAVAWLVKRLGIADKFTGAAVKGRHLSVEEVLMLDTKRRLVLVRRGDTGHLLLLGTHTDIIVETGITLTAPVAEKTEDKAVIERIKHEPRLSA